MQEQHSWLRWKTDFFMSRGRGASESGDYTWSAFPMWIHCWWLCYTRSIHLYPRRGFCMSCRKRTK